MLISSQNLSFSSHIVKHLPPAIRKRLPADIVIVAVSEKESRRLNRAYRNKQKPANVLSFLYDKGYGEIIVCPAVIRADAREQGHSVQYQMTWMLIHGMLHLAGVHHEKSPQAERRFEKIERDILSHFNL